MQEYRDNTGDITVKSYKSIPSFPVVTSLGKVAPS